MRCLKSRFDYRKVTLDLSEIIYVESRDTEVWVCATDGRKFRNKTGINPCGWHIRPRIKEIPSSESVQMTEDEISVVVAQVHPVSLTVAEPPAFAALALLHPRAVAVWLETVFPYIDEIISIDVSLMVVRAYASAG